ncbi:AsmA family protein [Roseobacteraceae bacterium S113]
MKWIVRLLALVVVVLVVAIVGVLMLPGDRLARIASDQLSAQLGRDVVIEGDVGLSVWPSVGVSTGPLRIANAQGFSEAPLFEADAAQIGLNAAALLQRRVQVERLIAERPRILLQQRADGTANWDFSTTSAQATPAAQSGTGAQNGEANTDGTAPALPNITIDRLQITDATIRIEQDGAAAIAYSDVDLDLSWPDMAGPADLAVSFAPAGQPVQFVGVLGAPLNMLAGGAHPVSGTLTAASGSVGFDGRASLTPEFTGTLTAALPQTSAFLAALGLGAADLPEGMGASVDATMQLTYTSDGRVALRGLAATLDHHEITGDADIALAGPVPKINAKLATNALKLGASEGARAGASSESSGDSASSSSTGGSDSGWSTAPIDASALALVDAEVLVDAPSLSVGGLSFGKSRFLLTNDRARAVFSIRELAAYDGAVTGEFVMNNRNGLSVGGTLQALGINAKTLLSDAGVTERLSGNANTEIRFLGVGQSLDAIMRSLSGEGAFQMAGGVISGLDLDQLMRNGGTGGGTTVFDTLGATYTMDAGILRNDDLLMTLPGIEARGEGKINLGAQTIDYTFTPNSLDSRDGRGLAIPVTVKGPWSDPRIDADLAKALDLNLKEEKEALEERVRDEVKERVQEELGVTVEDGDTVEDVLRKTLEEEAGNALRNLLGGN